MKIYTLWIVSSLFFVFSFVTAYAQNIPWLNTTGASLMKVSSDGYTYVASTVTNVTKDINVRKLNKRGVQVWSRTYDGPSNLDDRPAAMFLDQNEDVYIAGYADNTKRVVLKYNSNGTLQWATVDPEPDIETNAITVRSNKVYVTGVVFSTPTGRDIATSKYGAGGTREWLVTYNRASNYSDEAKDIAVDGSGNVYVAGSSSSSSSTATDVGYTVLKYDADGTLLWEAHYTANPSCGSCPNGGTATSLVVDGAGNVYVTGDASGTSNDIATVKFNSSGVQQWVQRFDGSGAGNDGVLDSKIALAPDDNVIVLGRVINADDQSDFALLKYSSVGSLLWSAIYNRTDKAMDDPYALIVDDDGYSNVMGSSVVPKKSSVVSLLRYDTNGSLVCEIHASSSGETPAGFGVDDNKGMFLCMPTYVARYLCASDPIAWTMQTGAGTTNLNDVVFANDQPAFSKIQSVSAAGDEGWIVGAKGTILHTTNKGIAWSLQTVPEKTPDLYSVAIYSDTAVVAVGKKGSVVRSLDHGTTWTASNDSGEPWTKNALYKLWIYDNFTGVATGKKGTVLKTTDAGITWKGGSTLAIEKMTDIFFLDTATGWAVGKKGAMMKTTDGGTTWTAMNDSGTPWTKVNLVRISFWNETKGFAIGDKGTVLYTNDGGTTWSSYTVSSKIKFTNLAWIKENQAYAIGKKGVVTMIEPMGYVSVTPTNVKNDLFGISVSNATELWVVGKKGIILYGQPAAVFSRNDYEMVESSEITSYQLQQNYPNPFNPTTTIGFAMQSPAIVTLKIFNLLGQQVAVLANNELFDEGEHEIEFDAAHLPSGVYFYHLSGRNEAGFFTDVKKMMLLK